MIAGGPEPRPNTEPAVDTAAQFGDCTDFVWVAVKNVLSPSWTHAKMSTRMFNNYDPTQLGKYGYVAVDSASVRPGDLVVRTKTSGCLCGHAGVFISWGVKGQAIGWANNGLPATPTRANVDSTTGIFTFKPRSGFLTEFFRPQTP